MSSSGAQLNSVDGSIFRPEAIVEDTDTRLMSMPFDPAGLAFATASASALTFSTSLSAEKRHLASFDEI
jgi:hypothetical protein